MIVAILIFSAVFIWLAFSTNSHVASFVIRGLSPNEGVRFLADGKAIQSYRQAKAAPREIVFRHIEGDGRTVCFTQPVNIYRSLLAPELFRTVKGDWRFDLTTKRWCAGEVGSELTLSGVFSVVEFAVEFGEQGGKLEIQNGNEVQTFDLGVPARKRLQQVYLHSPLTLVYAYFPPSSTSLSLELSQSEIGQKDVEGARLSEQARNVLVESATLYSRFSLIEQRRERVKLDGFNLQVPDSVRENGELFSILSSAAAAWGRVGLACLVFFIFGLVLVVPLAKVLTPLEGLLLAIGLGYSFLVLLSNSWSLLGLNYLKSFALTVLIWIALVRPLTLLSRVWSRKCQPLDLLVVAKGNAFLKLVSSGRREILPLVALSLATASAFFLPIFFRECYYFGEAYTDTWWYINLAEILKTVSPRVHMSDIWSHQRIADLTSLSLFSVLTFQSPFFAYGQHLLLFWFLCPLFSYAIANRLFATLTAERQFVSGSDDRTENGAIRGGMRIVPLLAFVFTACSAFLYAIVAESYMAHFLFLFVNLLAILLSMIVLRVFSVFHAGESNKEDSKEDGALSGSRDHSGSHLLVIIAATGLVYAHAVSLYPYHFFLPIALLAGFVALWRKHSTASGRTSSHLLRRIFAPYVGIGIMTVLFANINLCLVLNVTANSTYFDNLNQIARYIVFPFYHSLEFANIFFGLSDFQLHSRFMEQLLAELYLESRNLMDHNLIVGGWDVSRMLAGMLFPVVCIVYLLGIICLMRRIRSPYHVVLLVLLCCYTGLSIWQYKSDQVYGFGKMVMTVASLTPLVMAIGLGHPSIWSGRTMLAPVAGGLVMLLASLLVLGNFVAVYPSVMVQRVFHSSGVLREARSHISAVSGDTREIARLLGDGSAHPKGAVLIYGYPEELAGSDKDRVFFWSLWSLLEGRSLFSNASLPLGFLGTNYRALLPDAELLELIKLGNVDAIIAFRPLPAAMRRELQLEFQSSLYGVYTLRGIGVIAAE